MSQGKSKGGDSAFSISFIAACNALHTFSLRGMDFFRYLFLPRRIILALSDVIPFSRPLFFSVKIMPYCLRLIMRDPKWRSFRYSCFSRLSNSISLSRILLICPDILFSIFPLSFTICMSFSISNYM